MTLNLGLICSHERKRRGKEESKEEKKGERREQGGESIPMIRSLKYLRERCSGSGSIGPSPVQFGFLALGLGFGFRVPAFGIQVSGQGYLGGGGPSTGCWFRIPWLNPLVGGDSRIPLVEGIRGDSRI